MRFLLTAATLALTAVSVFAADLGQGAAGLPSETGIPACDDPKVLSDIIDRQHWAEENTWKNGVRIEAITAIRQAYPVVRAPSAVEHRHCRAVATLGPGRSDQLLYMISKDLGFASLSWYVDFCMPRHDYYRVYNAACRVLR
ncbi:MAG TPA: hypothetical protein VMP03_13685 [Methylomirabilota bacterium]|nr:hypothetical protein [Methylomirabilota bacterium]